ncbi:MAG: hypothetical protein M1814_004996 [Vezdaea aestivalis]|nr:MAG: hypothetical protein M1814_004996 [Vezdaea aestivalis]
MSSQHYYTPTPPMPVVGGKGTHYVPPYQHAGYRTTSVSPPERPQSSTASGPHSSVPSYSNSATSSSYAGSATGEYDVPTSSIDLMDLLNDRMETAYNPLPMDHSLAKQTQTYVDTFSFFSPCIVVVRRRYYFAILILSHFGDLNASARLRRQTHFSGLNRCFKRVSADRVTFRSGALNAKQRELLELQALAQRRLAGAQSNFRDGIQAAKDVKRDLEWTQKRVTALNRKAERKYPQQYYAAQAQYPSLAEY